LSRQVKARQIQVSLKLAYGHRWSVVAEKVGERKKRKRKSKEKRREIKNSNF